MKKDVTEMKQGSFVEYNGVLPLKGLYLIQNDILHFMGVGSFPDFFQGATKSDEICFFPLKTKKTTFFC